ncbi:MAG: tRNA (adenosine(37)-N6)-threonylcarbamoyltransferase complex dimerization subunit type 1 TsaB [Deltaproteobacteria bacterium]|nr:tRNA (adenosine(37)-N6)-threonylcarbamoyltransferase complex dimerization subunit type 1 TsaB [Deltaproteobacteria bacterium]
MLLLGLDTATQIASVGITRGEEVLAEASTRATSNHTETLLPLIAEVLAQAQVTLPDIEGIGVAIGPGSFTGLRIALGTVKGLAYATGQPVAGIPTLEALAYTVSDWAGLVCPILDARKREVYTALFYRSASGEIAPVRSAQVSTLKSVLEQISAPCLFLGDGVETYGEAIREHCSDRAHLLPFETYHPRGAVVAKLAWRRLSRSDADDIATLVPSYVRPPEAVLKRTS